MNLNSQQKIPSRMKLDLIITLILIIYATVNRDFALSWNPVSRNVRDVNGH